MVTLIPGDGIGKELSESVKSVFKASNVPILWDEYNVSGNVRDKQNDEKMKAAIDSLRRNKVGLKGICFTFYSFIVGFG